MVKEIVKDTLFLMKSSETATKADMQTAYDLIDTLSANSDRCVGMAANMIGVSKRIIIAQTGIVPIVMLNPKIIKHSDECYEAEEGCLSLAGTRKTKRYNTIEVEYCDMKMRKKRQSFSGFAAQIIQHEIDHCNGVII